MGRPKPVSVYAATFDRLGRRDHLKTNVSWRPRDASGADVCDVEDAGTALVRFDNGSVIHLETAYSLNGAPVSGLDLYGEKGGFRTGTADGLTLFTETNGYLTDMKISTKNMKNVEPAMFVAEMQAFTDAVERGDVSTDSAEDGIAVMKILDAIYRSAETGHEVVID